MNHVNKERPRKKKPKTSEIWVTDPKDITFGNNEKVKALQSLLKEGETNGGEPSHKKEVRRPEGETPEIYDNREYTDEIESEHQHPDNPNRKKNKKETKIDEFTDEGRPSKKIVDVDMYGRKIIVPQSWKDSADKKWRGKKEVGKALEILIKTRAKIKIPEGSTYAQQVALQTERDRISDEEKKIKETKEYERGLKGFHSQKLTQPAINKPIDTGAKGDKKLEVVGGRNEAFIPTSGKTLGHPKSERVYQEGKWSKAFRGDNSKVTDKKIQQGFKFRNQKDKEKIKALKLNLMKVNRYREQYPWGKEDKKQTFGGQSTYARHGDDSLEDDTNNLAYNDAHPKRVTQPTGKKPTLAESGNTQNASFHGREFADSQPKGSGSPKDLKIKALKLNLLKGKFSRPVSGARVGVGSLSHLSNIKDENPPSELRSRPRQRKEGGLGGNPSGMNPQYNNLTLDEKRELTGNKDRKRNIVQGAKQRKLLEQMAENKKRKEQKP